MKKVFITIVFLLLTGNIFSQSLTEERKEELIQIISNVQTIFDYDPSEVSNALKIIRENKVYEAIPAIINNVMTIGITLRIEYLETLVELNVPESQQMIHAYIDTLETNYRDDSWRLTEEVWANTLLMKFNDFSKIEFVFAIFENLEYKEDMSHYRGIDLLSDIIKQSAEYAPRARYLLEQAVTNENNDQNRFSALFKLEEIYKYDAFPYIKKMLEEDTVANNRNLAIQYCEKYPTAEALLLLRESLYIEGDRMNLTLIYDVLLADYSCPFNYNYLLEYLPNEPDQESQEYLRSRLLIHEIGSPDENRSVISLVDSLSSYIIQCSSLSWIDTSMANAFLLQAENAKNYLEEGDSLSCAKKLTMLKQKADYEYNDSLNVTESFVTANGKIFINTFAKYILNHLPSVPAEMNFNIKLLNSTGTLLTGGSLQYYEGGWKDAINNGDGTFLVDSTLSSVSLKMTYEYGTQTLSNVSLANGNVAVFQTVNTEVKLQNSSGISLDTGTVQYYAGAWREFGTTTNGTAYKELLPNTYSFRMTYANAGNDKQQNISANSTVTFNTVNAAVELRNSSGSLMDAGTVQYYAGAWREFGTTTNGTAYKELLPNTYSFRMTYANAGNDKQQNISANSTVTFNTVNAAVELRNSSGSLMDAGTVQYYAGAWREFGTTTNGTAYKELLPNTYSFRMTYANAGNDKQQNISANSTVTFNTVNAAVELRNSSGSLMDAGTVQYYAGAWREFGTTTNGTAYKELLPNTYSFRTTHEYVSNDKQQNIGTNSTVTFSTKACSVTVKNAEGQPANSADIKYYAGAWRQFGTTVNGEAVKELLPANLSFRASYNGVQKDKTQNTAENSTVEFVFP